MHESLQQKILTLPDDTVVYPAHGAGSLCGRQMGSENSSTIGKERRSNYALLAKSQDEFVHLLTDNLTAAPGYFAQDAELNRRGAESLSQMPALAPLHAREVLELQQQGAVVVDTRPSIEFAAAHVPGSIHIALSGQYASWAARILGLNTRLILVGEDPDHVRESQLRLARVGMENFAGFLEDGVAGWVQGGFELESIPQITAPDLADLRHQDADGVVVLDVREPSEREGGAIEGSISIPLGQLSARMAELDADKLLVTHCKGGYRSAIAVSLLRRGGFRNIANLMGGFDAWKNAGGQRKLGHSESSQNS